MTGHKHHSHFGDKKPLQHVTEARRKGKLASSEIHGEELSGPASAAGSSAKETALIIVLLSALFTDGTSIHLHLLVPFLFGWFIWKTGSSAILGWRRLERLHRLIEEERYEIEHHRPQEREELTALYQAKGFAGKQLEEVIDVLMADDNRLLQIMLEEELGLSLETIEHPLKQAAGAALGTLVASALLLGSLLLLPTLATLFSCALIIALCSAITAHQEKNQILPSLIWNLAIAMLSYGCATFLRQFLSA